METQDSFTYPFVKRPAYKTLKERQYDFITNLIKERSFHFHTASSIAKRTKFRLPFVCYRLVGSESDDTLEFNEKFCHVASKRPEIQTTKFESLEKMPSKDETWKEEDSFQQETTISSIKSRDFEVRHQSARNWLTLEVYKSDIFEDEKERLALERLKQQAQDTDKNKKDKSPLKYFQSQLQTIRKNLKKGPIDYETWARQKYEIAYLELKIKQEKKQELLKSIRK